MGYLKTAGKTVVEFSGIRSNPTYAKVLEGAALAKKEKVDLILAVGGGSVMDCTEDKTGTLRAQQHGHQPLDFENHGIDSRYTGPHPIVPTLSARAGTGGNNLPLALQPEPTMCICGNAIDRQPRNGGNGIGIQNDVDYTLPSVDRHAIFRRPRAD